MGPRIDEPADARHHVSSVTNPSSKMPNAAALPRATRIVTVVAALGFLSLLVCGPLLEATLLESLFALALIVTAVVFVAFATRRPAFALTLPTILFGLILV